MAYAIKIDRDAEREMRRLPRHIYRRVSNKLEELSEVPRPRGCRLVREAPKNTYRVWVGRQYRIVYMVYDEEEVILVVRVRHKDKDTYTGLRTP